MTDEHTDDSSTKNGDSKFNSMKDLSALISRLILEVISKKGPGWEIELTKALEGVNLNDDIYGLIKLNMSTFLSNNVERMFSDSLTAIQLDERQNFIAGFKGSFSSLLNTLIKDNEDFLELGFQTFVDLVKMEKKWVEEIKDLKDSVNYDSLDAGNPIKRHIDEFLLNMSTKIWESLNQNLSTAIGDFQLEYNKLARGLQQEMSEKISDMIRS